MSDIIITQSDAQQDTSGAVSAFSRYAYIYGLKTDAWRDGQACGVVPSETESSKKWHGNWFCF